MNLSTGCMHCDLLKYNDALTEISCKKNPELKLTNAGACILAVFGDKKIIVENCPDFK